MKIKVDILRLMLGLPDLVFNQFKDYVVFVGVVFVNMKELGQRVFSQF